MRELLSFACYAIFAAGGVAAVIVTALGLLRLSIGCIPECLCGDPDCGGRCWDKE